MENFGITIILVLCGSICASLWVLNVRLNTLRTGNDGSKDFREENDYSNISKFASPLAYDDRVLMCSTAEESETVREKIELSLKEISHVWQPQELLQLLQIVRGWLSRDGKPFDNYHSYMLLRYLEALVMGLNFQNGYWLEQPSKNSVDLEERSRIFGEINHLYSLAKTIGESRHDKGQQADQTPRGGRKLPGEGLNLLANARPGKDFIDVSGYPKPKAATGNKKIIEDLHRHSPAPSSSSHDGNKENTNTQKSDQ
jgi:hypothetical protein